MPVLVLMTAVAENAYRYFAARLRWHLTLRLPGPLQALAATLGGERRFTDVLFAFDKSDLTDKAMSDLDSAAGTINELSEQDPNLRIHPEDPQAGETLRVEYHGGALFSDETHLALRARFRAADRTLKHEEVDSQMDAVMNELQSRFNAEIRK